MTEPHEQYVARFQRAQAEALARLRVSVEDRPAHAHYLNALLEAPLDQIDSVPATGRSKVSPGMAAALLEDVAWLRHPAPEPGWMVSNFPNAYARRRAATAQIVAKQAASRIARRAGTAPSLAELLKLKNP